MLSKITWLSSAQHGCSGGDRSSGGSPGFGTVVSRSCEAPAARSSSAQSKSHSARVRRRVATAGCSLINRKLWPTLTATAAERQSSASIASNRIRIAGIQGSPRVQPEETLSQQSHHETTEKQRISNPSAESTSLFSASFALFGQALD